MSSGNKSKGGPWASAPLSHRVEGRELKLKKTEA